jgi:plasmid stabilization system protein ParE
MKKCGIDALAEMPMMGKVAELPTEREYRELVIEHYKIYYFPEGSQLVIGRLWDTRRDPTQFFIPRS